MKKLTLALLLVILLLSACANVPATPQANKPVVMVSVQPQAYFVQKIAGDLVEVQAMVGTGDDPHTYEPTTEQMRSLTNAQLFFSIGWSSKQLGCHVLLQLTLTSRLWILPRGWCVFPLHLAIMGKKQGNQTRTFGSPPAGLNKFQLTW